MGREGALWRHNRSSSTSETAARPPAEAGRRASARRLPKVMYFTLFHMIFINLFMSDLFGVLFRDVFDNILQYITIQFHRIILHFILFF